MAVPFVDLKEEYLVCKEEIDSNIASVINNCSFIGGSMVADFEKEMAKHQEVSEVAGCANCTEALWLTLVSFGIRQGDEVITTPCTAIPTSEAITLAGANVVFADIEKGGYNISVESIKQKITPKTKAIIPVHLYGMPCDMEAICALAKEKGLVVIEDCAQAQGARLNGTRVGNFGDAACFSFFPSKNLGGFGDGGAMTAKEKAVIDKFRMHSNHGRLSKLEHAVEGVNSRLDAIQAAALLPKIKILDQRNEMRRKAAQSYYRKLGKIPEISLINLSGNVEPIWHIFPIGVDDRDALKEFLGGKKIATGLHYSMSLNLQKAYSYLNTPEGSFPEAEAAFCRELSLPMFPGITELQIDEVCQAISEFYN